MSNTVIYFLLFAISAIIFGAAFEYLARRPSITIPRISPLASWGSTILVGALISWLVGVNIFIGAIIICLGCFVGLMVMFIYALATTKRGLH